MLKHKFRRLHTTVVNNVNPASIINFLFQEDVVGVNDMSALQKLRDDPQQQCSERLTLLHASENPHAFVQLYAAIKDESHLRWLTDRIDKFTDQSLIGVLQQRYISDPTGECVSNNLLFISHHCETHRETEQTATTKQKLRKLPHTNTHRTRVVRDHIRPPRSIWFGSLSLIHI